MKKYLLFLFLAGAASAPSQAAVAHTKSSAGFCSTGSSSGIIASTCDTVTTQTFTYTAVATNEAVVFGIACNGTTETTATLSATGWTITSLSGPTGANGSWIASFGALAPNTSAATFTMTWSGNCTFMTAWADEFSGNDTTGGTTTFDAHNAAFNASTGTCTLSVTPANANDGLWAACSDSVTGVGTTGTCASAGCTKGGDDTQGDWSEWKILVGQSGTAQTVPFVGTSGQWSEVAVTIKPAGAAARTMPPAVY